MKWLYLAGGVSSLVAFYLLVTHCGFGKSEETTAEHKRRVWKRPPDRERMYRGLAEDEVGAA